MALKPTYIIIDPATPKGKYQVCRLMLNKRYVSLCECRSQGAAEQIVTALANDEFTGKIVDSMRTYKQAAE